MSLQIKTVQEHQYYLKVLLYGDPGVGKTTLAAMFPDPVFLDWDRGTHTLKNQPGFDHVRVAQPSNFSEAKDFLRAVSKKEVECKTLVIDTMTVLQNRLLIEIAGSKHAKEPSVYDEDVNTLPDFNKVTNSIYKLLWNYRELPVNLVVITHAREEKDKITEQFKIKPDLTPKLANVVGGMMDIVGYYAMNDDKKIPAKRVLTISPTRRLIAKNRIGLPDMIPDPSYESFNGKQRGK